MKYRLGIFKIFLTIMLSISSLAMTEEKTYDCLRLPQEPEMDGQIIGDPAWHSIKPVFDFIRIDTKQPASK